MTAPKSLKIMAFRPFLTALLSSLVFPFIFSGGDLAGGQDPSSPSSGRASGGLPDTEKTTVYLASGDDLAINAAIRSLPPEGGRVILGPVLFPVSAAIVIDRDNVELHGISSATTLRLTDSANCSVVVIGSTATPVARIVKNVAVRNLVIDGNRGAQQFECCGGPCDQGGLSHIRNNGITVRGTENSTISNVITHNCRSGGIVLEKHCRRIEIRDFESYNNEFDGLAAYETEECTFTQMKLYDNRSAAASFDWKFNRNVISDSLLIGNGGQGIFMRDSIGNEFRNLYLNDNGEQGIFIAETREIADSACRENRFDRVVVRANRTQGIRVNDASCVGNVITNSIVTGNKGDNISLAVEGILTGADTVTTEAGDETFP
jgi:parallel beta-helix repeat protein